MLRIVADNYINPEKREEFLELARQLVDATRTEEGNLSYSLHQDKADANHLTFIEEWEDETAIKSHNSSEHFTSLVPKMAEYTSKPGTCFVYEILF